MQKNILQESINLKKEKKEFSIITNLSTAKNYIYCPDTKMHEDLQNFSKAIDLAFKKKKTPLKQQIAPRIVFAYFHSYP